MCIELEKCRTLLHWAMFLHKPYIINPVIVGKVPWDELFDLTPPRTAVSRYLFLSENCPLINPARTNSFHGSESTDECIYNILELVMEGTCWSCWFRRCIHALIGWGKCIHGLNIIRFYKLTLIVFAGKTSVATFLVFYLFIYFYYWEFFALCFWEWLFDYF